MLPRADASIRPYNCTFKSVPSKPILYPVRRKISTDLARFYKSDTNQPGHGTRPGQPVPGG